MMKEIDIEMDQNGGAFVFRREGEQNLARMEFRIHGQRMTVLHTEVDPSLKGQSIGARLFDAMIDHARKEDLKIVPRCSYVSAMLSRHPEKYRDLMDNE